MARVGTDLGNQATNTKIPPGWDGVSKSLREYLEEVEDWLGYTELTDHPGRIGPALKSRLSGKPKLVAKTLTRAQLEAAGGVDPSVTGAPYQKAGYEALLDLLKDKLQEDDSDFKWSEIKRFQTLKKMPRETFREFLAMFEVALDRAKDAGYGLSGDGPTYALFEACGLSEEVKQKVLTHTRGSLDFDEVCKAMKRVLDPSSSSVYNQDTDELRKRQVQNPQFPPRQAFFTEMSEEERTESGYGVPGGNRNIYWCEEPTHSEESEYEVSDKDREEFVALYTQQQQSSQGLRRFRKPYRPSQGKKRWLQAKSGSGTSSSAYPKKLYFLNESGQPVEASSEDILLASTVRRPPTGPTGSGNFGKNPFDKKTGQRMVCHACGSEEHFERNCPKHPKQNNVQFTQSAAHVEYFLCGEDGDSEDECTVHAAHEF